jgi:PPP family 3-phenylpropionic acid transporter
LRIGAVARSGGKFKGSESPVQKKNAFPRLAVDDSFGLRLSLFFATSFLIVGCYMPYLPLWLKWRGLSEPQIALIYAVPVFTRALFIPAMTFLADRYERPAGFITALSWGALATILVLPWAEGFAAIFAAVIVFTLFWMSVIPLTDTVALAGARAGRADYGRMRLWGSLSFILMTVGGGAAIDLWGPQAAIWLFIGAAALVLASAYLLPRDSDIGGGAVEAGAAPARPALRFADMIRLMKVPDLWLFLVAAGAVQSAHAVYYIFGTLHWNAAQISPTIIGALWAIGVIAEIALFAYAARVNRWFGPVQLLAIAAAAAAIRWTVTAFDPPLAVLFVVQAMHGLTYGAAHLGAMQFLTQAIPSRLAASAQGLYASITASVAMGLAALAAGPLYRVYGGQAYLAMAALGAVGLVLALVLMRRWSGGVIAEGERND